MKVRNSFELMNGMASIVRYSQSTLCKPESVLEHTGFVASICLIIGKNLNLLGAEINMASLLEKSLVHDMDETVTGDVARPTKYHSERIRIELDILSTESIREISQKINCPINQSWVNSKNGIDGKIVELADTLAVLCKVHDEIVMRGNKTMIFGSLTKLGERIESVSKELVEKIGCAEYFDMMRFECGNMSAEIKKEFI